MNDAKHDDLEHQNGIHGRPAAIGSLPEPGLNELLLNLLTLLRREVVQAKLLHVEGGEVPCDEAFQQRPLGLEVIVLVEVGQLTGDLVCEAGEELLGGGGG